MFRILDYTDFFRRVLSTCSREIEWQFYKGIVPYTIIQSWKNGRAQPVAADSETGEYMILDLVHRQVELSSFEYDPEAMVLLDSIYERFVDRLERYYLRAELTRFMGATSNIVNTISLDLNRLHGRLYS